MLFQVKRCVYVRNSLEFTVWGLADVLSACSLQHLVSASSGSNDGKLVVTRAVQSLFGFFGSACVTAKEKRKNERLGCESLLSRPKALRV